MCSKQSTITKKLEYLGDRVPPRRWVSGLRTELAQLVFARATGPVVQNLQRRLVIHGLCPLEPRRSVDLQDRASSFCLCVTRGRGRGRCNSAFRQCGVHCRCSPSGLSSGVGYVSSVAYTRDKFPAVLSFMHTVAMNGGVPCIARHLSRGTLERRCMGCKDISVWSQQKKDRESLWSAFAGAESQSQEISCTKMIGWRACSKLAFFAPFI